LRRIWRVRLGFTDARFKGALQMETGEEPKNWRQSLLERMRPYQFNWIGRTKEGVSRWIGAPRGPSERICKNVIRYGIAMSVIGLVTTVAIMLRVEGSAPLGLLALIGGIHGIVFTVLGFWLRKLSRNLAPLKTLDELANEFGSTPETVQRLVEAHGIRARININNSNLYDPEEFLGSRSLLRGASAPQSPELLLRASHPSLTCTGSETLLRAADPAPAALTPVQQLFLEPDEEASHEEVIVRT
jgi:hypothetical protein